METSDYTGYRLLMFSIAYRMTGSVGDAEDIADGQVQAIRSVINPGKLHHLGPVSDVAR